MRYYQGWTTIGASNGRSGAEERREIAKSRRRVCYKRKTIDASDGADGLGFRVRVRVRV